MLGEVPAYQNKSPISNRDSAGKENARQPLSKGQQEKIASFVRGCYSQDFLAKDYANNVAYALITINAERLEL